MSEACVEMPRCELGAASPKPYLALDSSHKCEALAHKRQFKQITQSSPKRRDMIDVVRAGDAWLTCLKELRDYISPQRIIARCDEVQPGRAN